MTSDTIRDTLGRTPRASGSWAPAELQPRRRRFRAVLWGALALVVLLAALGWLFAFSPVFAARQVQVSGVQVLTADQVRAAAAVPLGRPLVRQDIQAIATRVAGLRLVRNVSVSRSWPQTVHINVEERAAVLAVAQDGGFGLVDGQGHVYNAVPKVPSGVVLAEVDPTNRSLLSAVGTVAAALPDGIERRVRQISAPSQDRIELRLTNGDVVVWGSVEESDLKAQVLPMLLRIKATTYDISAPRSPALR